MPEVYRTTDVAGHQNKAGYLSCPWHLRFHDGKDSSDNRNSFSRIMEVCVDETGPSSTVSNEQGVQHGSARESRIRQEGGSDDKKILLSERPEFHIHTYTDASFSTSGRRSRSGFLVCLVVPETGEYSVLQWSSRRQTIAAFSAAEAEIVAMSEGIMTSILTYDAAELLGVCVWGSLRCSRYR